ncbi:ARM repeat-containing protein [Gloeophyllum trabeum ATCC 11539]|uniref:ARM repeat-containing protein n=1 Tax=Gloeophyllum trabeum (strain ATCC 11539 / FP-39264 / Madison 617) TaxID=670483 RepID=S7QEJ2_GLOTA|nr:ARM repeat-containing protein [Gloeophyllum trabeum ATCC 11539]EPQ57852.1 ARM repeat-containing protein [Gloeophyllum trabeum ATCC 11539]
MTLMTPDVPTLKKVKNRVIGNPTEKLALTQDERFINALVDCVEPTASYDPRYADTPEDLRIEAAQVISSLAYGPEAALKNLLRFQAHQAFVCAVSNLQPTDSPALKAALARGLRVLGSSIADVVGPSMWGIRAEKSEARGEAKVALEYLFQAEILDLWLPLLEDPSIQVTMPIAQLIASAIRRAPHRQAVVDWLPPVDRAKESRKRGWEKPVRTSGKQGGWAARCLTALCQSQEAKVQEAALSAIAALAKENNPLSVALETLGPDGQSARSIALSLCKSRSTEVQIAASLCVTRIVRATTITEYGPLHIHPPAVDSPLVMVILPVLNRLIESPKVSHEAKMKACFILSYLVTDDRELCQLAFERGSLSKVSDLAKQITPLEKSSDWDEDEPESISCLREAALTAVACISMFDNDIRREITDNLDLLPVIHASLSHRHVGVRYAACQCVRAIARHVGALRTSIVDNELGSGIFRIFQKEEEDRQVTHAASAAICNLMNESSPLQKVFLEQGIVTRLIQLLNGDDPALRLNAIWAIKNTMYRATHEVKKNVMGQIGWEQFANLLTDPSADIQEQAIHVLQNIVDSEENIKMVFDEIGGDALLSAVEVALNSENEHVLRHGAALLSNLANGSAAYQDQILAHQELLSALRNCLIDHNVEVRKPAMACILQLSKSNLRSQQALRDANIHSVLQRMTDHSRGISLSPGGLGRHHLGVEDNLDVREMAREALEWLEHGEDMQC